MDIEKALDLIKEHGLINKILDKLLTPESLRAISEGLGKGIAEGMKQQ